MTQTIINMSIKDNKVISTINGFGREELQKVLDKMISDYSWKLEIYSDATLQHIDYKLIDPQLDDFDEYYEVRD